MKKQLVGSPLLSAMKAGHEDIALLLIKKGGRPLRGYLEKVISIAKKQKMLKILALLQNKKESQ